MPGTLDNDSFAPRIVGAGESWTPFLLDSTNKIYLTRLSIRNSTSVEIAEIWGNDGGVHMGNTKRHTTLTAYGRIQSVDENEVNAAFLNLRTALDGVSGSSEFTFYWHYDTGETRYLGWTNCKMIDYPWEQIQGPVPGRSKYSEDLQFTMVTPTTTPIDAAASDSITLTGANVTIQLTGGGPFKILQGSTIALQIDSDGNLLVKDLLIADTETIT
jgi:hypothetical protein